MGETVTFPSNGSQASGYLARPASGTGKGVLVIQEWWGVNQHIKNVTDRFAAEGFIALAPDLYHGVVTAEPDEAGKLLMALDINRAEKDLRGATNYLKEQSGGPVGVVGFCMGGAIALLAACKNGSNIGACVDFYGGHPAVTYDFETLTAPVLGLFAEHDGFANATIPVIENGLKDRGNFEIKVYPGTSHAFFNDDRADVYNADAAKDAWDRTLALFRANL